MGCCKLDLERSLALLGGITYAMLTYKTHPYIHTSLYIYMRL